ncbi:aminoacyl-tRNA hydrolase [Sneathiella sp. P13V-1]|uniref:aminoacyl-tRNA hydrolase n=1 Tax=Sneathiella sp. P13V-1 TaxID=2697366 RepID=UPI00187BC150|nr:aminoacyl-tRNA hydrolase [Sneathiella sp. P13V-1]MBE7638081.1 aminoacyl-tRNA hydrolase [Sneathiella sp. P13V-1]
MLLLVGLGNPGKGYANNRHNLGFMAVDEIIRRHSFSAERIRFLGITCDATIAGEKVLALKPNTYMNESGRSVGEAMRFFKIPPENVIVLHDELDLPTAKVRVKIGGGHGGNNGLRSIDAHIGKNYRRVRMGIGHPGDKNLVSGYVLHDFSKSELPAIEKTIDAVARHVALLIAGDDAGFMNKVALDTAPPKPQKQKQDK